MRGRYVSLITAWLAGLLSVLPWTAYGSAQFAGNPIDRTVIINEIGWGGTAASAADEWIELYNTANTSVDLAGWRLRAADGQPDVALSGTIGPLDYYLIERTDDSTISDIDGDLLSPFGTGLSNAGETLQLLDASGTAVDSANQDGGPWPNADEGAAPGYRSLERVDPLADDTDGNWASNDGSVINGLDNAGGAIQGTPRSANAAYLARFAAYADLKVEKRGPTHFSAGTLITFAISVTNTGTCTATEAIVTDPLADGLAFVDQAGQLPTGGQPAFSQFSTGLTWQLGDLAPGASGLVTLVVRLEDTGSGAGSIAGSLTNTVVVSTTADEVNLSDNKDTWTIEPDAAPILISAVLYDGYQLNDEDEAIELVNTGTTTGYLDGWSLCKDPGDGIVCWPLPAMVVAPGARVWVAKDEAAFALSFGFAPDYVAASWPRFANTGDEVILRSPTAFYRDTLVYGDRVTRTPGWTGPPVLPYANHLMGTAGQILSRKCDEATGLPVPDTDTSSDWLQSPDDPVTGRRVRYPGWDLAPLSFPLTTTEPARVIVGIAPDNAFDVISATLQSARRAISVEVYSLRHPDLLDLLVAKAQAGVDVTVLLEGNPVGVGVDTPEWQTQLYACQAIEEAGGTCWFMVHETADRRYNRYQYLHAKMIVVDDAWVLIGSQNLTQDGLPGDDKANGTAGSRGTVIATDAPSVVRRAALIFALDCDPAAHADLVRWNTLYPERYGSPALELVDLAPIDGISYTVAFPQPLVITGSLGLELFTAPEAALRRSDALLGLVARADEGDRIYVEQLYEYQSWGEDPVADPNLRLQILRRCGPPRGPGTDPAEWTELRGERPGRPGRESAHGAIYQ